METIAVIFVSLFSLSTVLLLSSQYERHSIKKGEELIKLFSKDR